MTVGGYTSVQTPGQAPLVSPGGLLAVGSNSGRFERDQFAVVPQVDATLGYQVTSWLRVHVGYSFLYWSSVARPGDQIDRGVNLHQVSTSQSAGTPGGPVRPGAVFRDADFWAQGASVSVSIGF